MTSIELAIRTRLDVIFSKYTPNPQLTEFKEELVADLLDAYQDFAQQDKSHDEALDDTFAQLGDIDAILQEMSAAQTQQTGADDDTAHDSRDHFFDFSDEGLRFGNLHISGQGVRLGDDIILDGKNNKVQFGDWLHVDRAGARVGRKFYAFDATQDAPSFTEQKNVNPPHWTAAHHNLQFPVTDKALVFNYQNATLNFYRNDKTDLVTIDEFFSRDNQRYFATVTETPDQVVVTQGDKPLLFQVRVHVNIGLPKNFSDGQLTVTNRAGQINVNDITLKTFNVTLTSGRFSVKHLQAQTANWHLQASDTMGQAITIDNTKITNQAGRIQLDHVTLPNSQINVTSGTLKIADFVGGGQFNTTSGTLRLKVKTLTQDLQLQAMSSTVRLTTPETQDYYFDLASPSGSVVMNRTHAIHFNHNSAQEKRGFTGQMPELTITAAVNLGTLKVY